MNWPNLTSNEILAYLASRHIMQGDWLWARHARYRVKVTSITTWKRTPGKVCIGTKFGLYTHHRIHSLAELHNEWLSDFEHEALRT